MNAAVKQRDYVPRRHLVSAAEYLCIGASGAFAPEARLELIEGEIVEMAPIGSGHAGAVITLNRLLVRRAIDAAAVSVQGPLVLSTTSVPQPDLALLKPRSDDYAGALPQVGDVLLLVEVSDSTLAFDLGAKADLYARAGIPELWVVDVNERSVRVFREPSAHGWRSSFTAMGEQRIACLALPGVELAASEAFPHAG